MLIVKSNWLPLATVVANAVILAVIVFVDVFIVQEIVVMFVPAVHDKEELKVGKVNAVGNCTNNTSPFAVGVCAVTTT